MRATKATAGAASSAPTKAKAYIAASASSFGSASVAEGRGIKDAGLKAPALHLNLRRRMPRLRAQLASNRRGRRGISTSEKEKAPT